MLLNVDGYGENAAREQTMSEDIGRVLVKYYPNYNWMVEANSFAGVATIRLLYADRLGKITRYGCMLHLSSYAGADAEMKIMRLGGELLERHRLRRGEAHKDTAHMFKQNGLIVDNAIRESRH